MSVSFDLDCMRTISASFKPDAETARINAAIDRARTKREEQEKRLKSTGADMEIDDGEPDEVLRCLSAYLHDEFGRGNRGTKITFRAIIGHLWFAPVDTRLPIWSDDPADDDAEITLESVARVGGHLVATYTAELIVGADHDHQAEWDEDVRGDRDCHARLDGGAA